MVMLSHKLNVLLAPIITIGIIGLNGGEAETVFDGAKGNCEHAVDEKLAGQAARTLLPTTVTFCPGSRESKLVTLMVVAFTHEHDALEARTNVSN